MLLAERRKFYSALQEVQRFDVHKNNIHVKFIDANQDFDFIENEVEIVKIDVTDVGTNMSVVERGLCVVKGIIGV